MLREFSLALLLIVFSTSVFAGNTPLDEPLPSPISKNWYWAATGLALVGGLSQIKDSNITFAALEAGAAFYMLNEWYKDDKAPLAKLITPLALTTLALINLTFLREDETSTGDVFRYNAGGLSLIAVNYFWSY